MVQKTAPRPQTPLRGRAGHDDSKSPMQGCDIRARLRDRRRALDYCGVVGPGDDLRSLSVQFGAGAGRQRRRAAGGSACVGQYRAYGLSVISGGRQGASLARIVSLSTGQRRNARLLRVGDRPHRSQPRSEESAGKSAFRPWRRSRRCRPRCRPHYRVADASESRCNRRRGGALPRRGSNLFSTTGSVCACE